MTPSKVFTPYRATSSHLRDHRVLQEAVYLLGIRRSDTPLREVIHQGDIHHRQDSHNDRRVSMHRRDIRNSSPLEAINRGRIRHTRNPECHSRAYNSRCRPNGVAPGRRDILHSKEVIPPRVATLLVKGSTDQASRPRPPQANKVNPKWSKTTARHLLTHGITQDWDQNIEFAVWLTAKPGRFGNHG
jgi:hypothetical protein